MVRLNLAIALLGALLLPRVTRSSDAALDEALRCATQHFPSASISLALELRSFDRMGGERKSKAKLLGKKLADDGLRRAVLRFDAPPDIAGSAMLMMESASGPPDFYVYSPDDRRVRRVVGRSANGLFGSDFSYDDFENWCGLSSNGERKRLDDAVVEGRPTYVVQSVHVDFESSYERVVSFIDRETCVVLKIESFEPGGKLRKVLRADPKRVEMHGSRAIAHELRLEDARDGTHTRLTIFDVKFDAEIPDRKFRVKDLDSRGE